MPFATASAFPTYEFLPVAKNSFAAGVSKSAGSILNELPSVVFTNETSASDEPANVIKETKSDDINTFLANIISPKNCLYFGLSQFQNIYYKKVFYLLINLILNNNLTHFSI